MQTKNLKTNGQTQVMRALLVCFDLQSMDLLEKHEVQMVVTLQYFIIALLSHLSFTTHKLLRHNNPTTQNLIKAQN